MATYYFLNTGNQNWNNGANWSLSDGGTPGAPSAFPTSVDDAIFTSLSGNCTVNVLSRCTNLTCSGAGAGDYTGTLTLSNVLQVYVDTLLSATMTLTNTASNYLQIGGGGFSGIAAMSCKTNGLAINVPVRCAAPAASTTTFTDNVIFNNTVWFIGGGNTNPAISSFSAGATFNNTVTIGNTGANYIQSNYTIAGNTTLQAKGNVIFGGTGNASNGFSGTTLFLINGTGPQTVGWTNTTGGATPPFVFGDITFNNSQITITMPSLKYSNATAGVDSTLTALTTVNANACTLTLVNRTINTRIACGLISGSNRWGGLSVTVGTGGSYTPTFLEDFYCVDFVCGSSLNVTAGTAGGKNIYVSGNWTGSGANNFDVGTASPCTVYLNGTGTQTWSGGGYNGMSVVINNPNVVISGQLYKAACTITALTTASFGGSPQVLNLSGNVTLNTSLITWPSVNYVANGGTLTFLSDLNCVTFISSNTNSFSGLYNINVSGNCSIGSITTSNTNVRMVGTGFIQIGGTWNINSSTGGIIIDSTGTVTLQGTAVIRWGSFQYVQGSVIISNLWTFGANSTNTNVTIDTNQLELQGPIAFTGVVTATFTTPFRYRGTSLTIGSAGQAATLNGETIYTSNLTIGGTTSVVTGTSKIIFDGTGTISSTQTTGYVGNNMDIDTSGVVDFTSDFRYSLGTLTYKAGKIRQNGRTLFFTTGACTVNGFNKVPLENVIIGPSGAMTITMDSFFRGMPGKPCKIRSTATGANFAINFSNGFEKLTSHVVIERCSILTGNLLVLTDNSINMHSGITINSPAIIASGNIGVRFINHSPNGVGNGLNYPPIRRYDLSGDYLVADPVYS